MKNLKNNVWKISTLAELENDLDITDLFTSDYYISSGDLSGIIEDIEYSGIELNRLIELTKNGYGGSVWTLYHVKIEDMYILINNQV